MSISALAWWLMARKASASIADDVRARAGLPPATQPMAGAAARPALDGSRLSRGEALQLAAWLDQSKFGGFFSRDGRRLEDVVAIWQVESALDPRAIGDHQLPEKSWGLGQVQGRVARIDYGVADPAAILDPYFGAELSMKHLKWSFDYLAGRMGQAPSVQVWIGSYNAGVGNAMKGVTPWAYVTKWKIAAGR